MRRKSFGEMACPIARGLERVGEWWNMLILRDAFAGISRFDDFQQSLGIAPTMLTRRLNALVENGLLERRRYSERPPRDEYVLTERGTDFRPVLIAIAGEDRIVPPRFGRALYDALPEPKRLALIPGAGHNDWFDRLDDAWWRQTIDFLLAGGH